MEQNLCNYSTKEIVEALEIIQDICKNNTCSECPFSDKDEICLIQEKAPVDWTKDSAACWKALR